ncbi:MAG: DUF3868 domain-containing protein [Muribaculaceae bacterium]|nr:DUF3868 domain-containing protein [Muribaculaceae bacterium]
MKTLYKLLISTALALFPVIGFAAASEVSPIEVTNARLVRNGSLMTVDMDVDLSSLKLKSNSAVVMVPMLVNGPDTLVLDGIGVYGRTRWYQFERSGKKPVSGKGEISLRYNKNLGMVHLNQNVNYAPWMNGATLEMSSTYYGCAGCSEQGSMMDHLAVYKVEREQFRPVFIFEDAVAETVKTRELSGKAYIDFPVNQTVIYPDYRRNTVELHKIIATIDSVKNDPDIKVTALSIKGFASPEGSYENNVRLARGRTEALMNYVQQLYMFPWGFIHTSYEPEDWEGLREWVQNSNIEDKLGILSIIDSNLAPDPKNTMIQTTYPQQYAFLLANVYPALRHSDYKIEYEIRGFTELSEITQLIKTSPQKLSLNEIYRYAATLDQNGEEYRDVMETAARLYPTDEKANINAANAAMMEGDYVAAERYLAKAGDGANSTYAKGVLAALQENYDEALRLVEQAVSLGFEDKAGVLRNLRNIVNYEN